MTTSFKLAFLVLAFVSFSPSLATPQLDTKNPGCDPTIHLCPDNDDQGVGNLT